MFRIKNHLLIILIGLLCVGCSASTNNKQNKIVINSTNESIKKFRLDNIDLINECKQYSDDNKDVDLNEIDDNRYYLLSKGLVKVCRLQGIGLSEETHAAIEKYLKDMEKLYKDNNIEIYS